MLSSKKWVSYQVKVGESHYKAKQNYEPNDYQISVKCRSYGQA